MFLLSMSSQAFTWPDVAMFAIFVGGFAVICLILIWGMTRK